MRRRVASLILGFLLAAVGRAEDTAVTADPATWLDDATRLLWTVTDNGYALDAAAADSWCRGLRSAGFDDWRLPTIDELASLYEKQSSRTIKIRSPFVLSPGGACLWSSTRGACCRQLPNAWGFDFTDGSTRGGGQLPGKSEGADWRALCVRGPASPSGS